MRFFGAKSVITEHRSGCTDLLSRICDSGSFCLPRLQMMPPMLNACILTAASKNVTAIQNMSKEMRRQIILDPRLQDPSGRILKDLTFPDAMRLIVVLKSTFMDAPLLNFRAQYLMNQDLPYDGQCIRRGGHYTKVYAPAVADAALRAKDTSYSSAPTIFVEIEILK